jgi:UDP-N-acetylmuramate--alanine ligase
MHLSNVELSNTWSHIKRVHFIGITSPFCSFCASTLIAKGIQVTASEQNQDSLAAQKWIKQGILFSGPHNAEFITDDVDLVIFPNGALPGNPEVAKTQSIDKPYVFIQQLLGQISRDFKTIAIAGTHGKTTTTSLVVWLLHKTLGTPNFIVGDAKDSISELNTNWESHPESEYLVIEACEYKKQFLDRAPKPYLSVITHIDLDHTDFYHSQDEYDTAFVEFLTPTDGFVIINMAGENEQNVLASYMQKIAVPATILDTTDLRRQFGKIDSLLFGIHNQENLLRAAGVGIALGLTEEQTTDALKTFPGVTSRFEFKGKTANATPVYKDFAHNPQKVHACLQGTREAFPDKRIIAVFQPHNFERTFTFKKELASSLQAADVIVVPNIYSIRESEQEKGLLTAADFVQEITAQFPDKKVILTNDAVPYTVTLKALQKIDAENSVIVIMSAGDIDKIIPQLIDESR